MLGEPAEASVSSAPAGLGPGNLEPLWPSLPGLRLPGRTGDKRLGEQQRPWLPCPCTLGKGQDGPLAGPQLLPPVRRTLFKLQLTEMLLWGLKSTWSQPLAP